LDSSDKELYKNKIKMGGHSELPTYKPGVFHPPTIKGRWVGTLMGATTFFFVFYRMYHDGGHHFVMDFVYSHLLDEPSPLGRTQDAGISGKSGRQVRDSSLKGQYSWTSLMWNLDNLDHFS
jgi:hypothetical protein